LLCHGTVCVVGKMRDLILQLSKSSIYSTKPIKNSVDVKYYSLLVGPAYRINNYVSLYALGGAAYVKATGSTKWINAGDVTANYEDISEKSASFAYGAGVIINPVENLSVNIGYEGTQADLAGSYSINGFNVGIGYRF
ncbi:Ail/Lom family outer membrane beta-barrel protein, partial [Klebsiella aerogenes]|uniref:Ail/Lom family outer membrane beta-barrel protein n=1 Tax=Klebsiella aerogenes TaxID=548 RepID=UPI003D3466C5